MSVVGNALPPNRTTHYLFIFDQFFDIKLVYVHHAQLSQLQDKRVRRLERCSLAAEHSPVAILFLALHLTRRFSHIDLAHTKGKYKIAAALPLRNRTAT